MFGYDVTGYIKTIFDDNKLYEIATNSSYFEIRRMAILQMSDNRLLLNLFYQSNDWLVVMIVVQRLLDMNSTEALAEILLGNTHELAKSTIMKRMHRSKALELALKKHTLSFDNRIMARLCIKRNRKDEKGYSHEFLDYLIKKHLDHTQDIITREFQNSPYNTTIRYPSLIDFEIMTLAGVKDDIIKIKKPPE